MSREFKHNVVIVIAVFLTPFIVISSYNITQEYIKAEKIRDEYNVYR